jgi:hypothetical protein
MVHTGADFLLEAGLLLDEGLVGADFKQALTS